MRSKLHLTFTILITLFAVHQSYQLQQINKSSTLEVKPQTDFHFAGMQLDCNTTAAIGVDNMNILLAGIDNPISVAMTDVPAENLEVSIDNGEVFPKGNGVFDIQTTKIGKVTISVSGKNRLGEFCSHQQSFRVKRLSLVPRLGNKSGGKMGRGELRAQRGIMAIVIGVDIDARMNIIGFDVDLIREGADNQGVYNEGGAFTPAAMKLIQQAQIGDKYFFSDIKVREFDGTTRDLEQDMLFEIQ